MKISVYSSPNVFSIKYFDNDVMIGQCSCSRRSNSNIIWNLVLLHINLKFKERESEILDSLLSNIKEKGYIMLTRKMV